MELYCICDKSAPLSRTHACACKNYFFFGFHLTSVVHLSNIIACLHASLFFPLKVLVFNWIYIAGYITTAINDGPGCLLLRCPDPACCAAVGQDMILKLASDEDREKYSRYFVRSYIVDKKKVDFLYYIELLNFFLRFNLL